MVSLTHASPIPSPLPDPMDPAIAAALMAAQIAAAQAAAAQGGRGIDIPIRTPPPGAPQEGPSSSYQPDRSQGVPDSGRASQPGRNKKRDGSPGDDHISSAYLSTQRSRGSNEAGHRPRSLLPVLNKRWRWKKREELNIRSFSGRGAVLHEEVVASNASIM
ncbi:hypothetical protein FBU30_005103 [Linnemannia zychae]|nr:hypothetical protein FBU30_005103 [Linnemannia zychae]